MKKICCLLLLLSMNSCSDEPISQEQEANNLIKLSKEFTSMVENENCVNPEDWRFVDFGSKACGGPQGYIAYSINIDTVAFLKKIEEHRIAEITFNEKWGVFSDCSIPASPSEVVCENGKPVLVYP